LIPAKLRFQISLQVFENREKTHLPHAPGQIDNPHDAIAHVFTTNVVAVAIRGHAQESEKKQ
jgi:hypothetical protein